jgi:hypothetical protein
VTSTRGVLPAIVSTPTCDAGHPALLLDRLTSNRNTTLKLPATGYAVFPASQQDVATHRALRVRLRLGASEQIDGVLLRLKPAMFMMPCHRGV